MRSGRKARCCLLPGPSVLGPASCVSLLSSHWAEGHRRTAQRAPSSHLSAPSPAWALRPEGLPIPLPARTPLVPQEAPLQHVPLRGPLGFSAEGPWLQGWGSRCWGAGLGLPSTGRGSRPGAGVLTACLHTSPRHQCEGPLVPAWQLRAGCGDKNGVSAQILLTERAQSPWGPRPALGCWEPGRHLGL